MESCSLSFSVGANLLASTTALLLNLNQDVPAHQNHVKHPVRMCGTPRVEAEAVPTSAL